MLKDQKPENERANMDPDHWYELNLTNSFRFSNLTAADDAKQLVPGRLFTTRMPRNIYDKSMKEGKDFEEKVAKNNLKVVLAPALAYNPFILQAHKSLTRIFAKKNDCSLLCIYSQSRTPDPYHNKP